MAKLPVKQSPSTTPTPDRAARCGYVSQSEAAAYLGVTARTVRQMAADGRLIGYRAGSRLVRYKIADLDAAMQPFGGAA